MTGMCDDNGVRVPVTVLQVRFAFFVCHSLVSEHVFFAVGELSSHSKHQNGQTRSDSTMLSESLLPTGLTRPLRLRCEVISGRQRFILSVL